MKLTKEHFEEDFPININISNIVKIPPHYHNDIELVLVLSGELILRNGPFEYLMRPGDIFTCNRCEVHSMRSNSAGNVVAIIKISSQFFTRFFPNLSQSTYMFYSDKEKIPKQEHLKHMLLSLIYNYLIRGHNYKQKCIDETRQIIEYLNINFDVFGFENNKLTKLDSNNPITIQRIHNIIHYTYENHSSNITLNDLAELEHLNPYYLSHLIKDSMGISFVQFLYFVRVEWSEVNLLNPNKKISTIAKEVGFSSTAYYRKYFEQWFGCPPEEYRKKYLPLIKSDRNPDVTHPVTNYIAPIKRMLRSSDIYDGTQSFIKRQLVDVKIDKSTPSIAIMNHCPSLIITTEDVNVLEENLLRCLIELGCSNVSLLCKRSDSPVEAISIKDYLYANGVHVSFIENYEKELDAAGVDSIAICFYILNKYFTNVENQFNIPLRDQGNPSELLKGTYSLMTASAIPKPSYYAFQLLSMIKGELLSSGEYHAVIKLTKPNISYAVISYNYDKTIEDLCHSHLNEYEVQSAINSFKDELVFSAKIALPEGRYLVQKNTLSDYNNIFDAVAKMNFPRTLQLFAPCTLSPYTAPQTEMYITDVKDVLEISSNFTGVGIQLTLIQKQL